MNKSKKKILTRSNLIKLTALLLISIIIIAIYLSMRTPTLTCYNGESVDQARTEINEQDWEMTMDATATYEIVNDENPLIHIVVEIHIDTSFGLPVPSINPTVARMVFGNIYREQILILDSGMSTENHIVKYADSVEMTTIVGIGNVIDIYVQFFDGRCGIYWLVEPNVMIL
ncbi:MAG: hypothetical protein ACXAD7_12205 [Candidatus Kariarchaeaceae archaeon]